MITLTETASAHDIVTALAKAVDTAQTWKPPSLTGGIILNPTPVPVGYSCAIRIGNVRVVE